MLVSSLAALLLAIPSQVERADLADLLESVREKRALPALGACVVRGEEVIALGAVGVRKLGDPTPVTAQDLWHLGSCTKSMTATLLARLVERELLRWDSTVGEVFGESVPGMDPAWKEITMALLLEHRAGAPADLERDGLWGRLWSSTAEPRAKRRLLLDGVLIHPPVKTPGTEFLYSNAGYAIAGAMAEQVVDAPWEELMSREIFVPLGMTEVGFGAPGSASALDQPWGHRTSGEELVPVAPGPQADNPSAIGPAGTVHASLEDWARYATFHLRGERGLLSEGALLTNETIRRLHTPSAGADYALGWGVVPSFLHAGRGLVHTGSNTMWASKIWILPDENLALLVATNAANTSAFQTLDEVARLLVERAVPVDGRLDPDY